MVSPGYLIGVICIFISIFYISSLLMEIAGSKRWKVLSRLKQISSLDGELSELEPLNLPFKERIIRPALQKAGRFIESLTPAQIKKSLNDKLIAAGYNRKSAILNFMILQAVLAVLFPLFFMLIALLSGAGASKAILLVLMGFLLSIVMPVTILNKKRKTRQERIRKGLPDMLDLLVISVEAGLGFDAALVKVTEKIKGPLSEELNNALSEIRIGRVRRLALKEMAERTGVEELISFISAVFQADQLGVGIGNVLRVQADAMRTFRRQRAEEQAAKAPVKMLFPLVFCILPSLFVVILGPALIKFIEIFTGIGE